MLMVIFGAGASYDSDEDVPASLPSPPPRDPAGQHFQTAASVLPPTSSPLDRIPLANELFDGRADFAAALNAFPQVRSIAARLRRTENLEIELDAIAEKGTDDPQVGVQLMALRYYLQRIISDAQRAWHGYNQGVDNYHSLVDEIRNWQTQSGREVIFVSFNYDTLLEEACADSLYQFGNPTDLSWYVDHELLRIYKPHGSLDWGQVVMDDIRNEPKVAIDLGYNLSISTDEIIYRPPGLIARNDPGAHINTIPAIALPFQDKPNRFVMPLDHRQRLEVDLSRVTDVLVVGWRGTEAHFLESWREHRNQETRCVVVNGGRGAADATGANLAREGCTDRLVSLEVGFSEFVTGRRYLNEILR